MFKKKEKPELPIPLAHWYNDQAAIERLREILDDEVFRRAVVTLQHNALPTIGGISTDPNANSNKTIWLAGYSDFVKDLSRLTTRPTNQTQNQIEEWTQ